MNTKERMQQVLNNFVNDYSGSPPKKHRAVSGSGTCYYELCSNNCAVGNKMTPEGIEKYSCIEGDYFTLVNGFEFNDEYFQEDCRGFPGGFWASLQKLHDDNDNWKRVGESVILSPLGNSFRTFILNMIQNDGFGVVND